ncbi:MAG: cytochrome c oxidase subunit II [Candidatus Nanopelagicales bacterium]
MSTVDDRTPLVDEPEEPTNRPAATHRMKDWLRRPYARRLIIIACLFVIAILVVLVFAIWVTNTSGAPASAIMQEIEETMVVLTVVSAPLMAFTIAILLYSIFGWDHVTGDEPPMQESPAIRSNSTAVIIWISATSLLAAFLVIWGLIELAGITSSSYGTVPANQQRGFPRPIEVNVTGQQWVWSFEYTDQGGVQSDELVLPVDEPVYFNVTSMDVVHSFWVVELGIKIDANPGAITNTGVTPNSIGTYNIRCAELCGLHHAYMQTTVRVVTRDEFDSWIREMGGGRTS